MRTTLLLLPLLVWSSAPVNATGITADDLNRVEAPAAARPVTSPQRGLDRASAVASLRRVDALRAGLFHARTAEDLARRVEHEKRVDGFLDERARSDRNRTLIAGAALAGVGALFVAAPMATSALRDAAAIGGNRSLDDPEASRPKVPSYGEHLRTARGRDLVERALVAFRATRPEEAAHLALFQQSLLTAANVSLARASEDLLASDVVLDPAAANAAPLVWGLRFDAHSGTVVLSLDELLAARRDGGYKLLAAAAAAVAEAEGRLPERRLRSLEEHNAKLSAELNRIDRELSYRKSFVRHLPGVTRPERSDFANLSTNELAALKAATRTAQLREGYDRYRFSVYVERGYWEGHLKLDEEEARADLGRAENDQRAARAVLESLSGVSSEQLLEAVKTIRALAVPTPVVASRPTPGTR